ncbi:hypothetical protein HZH66_003858 [Vespula vulgaris]|uniref:Uncharacterized protein n=1 Tax=Vespula vulgaris TaxID=7454 RepID=A0A834KFG8_VESVU|nr:hypothetical protein HZH66_003858 [Vespula vulgaris]
METAAVAGATAVTAGCGTATGAAVAQEIRIERMGSSVRSGQVTSEPDEYPYQSSWVVALPRLKNSLRHNSKAVVIDGGKVLRSRCSSLRKQDNVTKTLKNILGV